jgi:hypothetical protein
LSGQGWELAWAARRALEFERDEARAGAERAQMDLAASKTAIRSHPRTHPPNVPRIAPMQNAGMYAHTHCTRTPV